MTLLVRVKSKSFLRSSCQGLSEYVVGSSGIHFFTRLDSGEQWYYSYSTHWRSICYAATQEKKAIVGSRASSICFAVS